MQRKISSEAPRTNLIDRFVIHIGFRPELSIRNWPLINATQSKGPLKIHLMVIVALQVIVDVFIYRLSPAPMQRVQGNAS